MDSGGNNSATDPFTSFWSDWMKQMTAMGAVAPGAPSSDAAMKQMRQAFFDAWARHCEEFMRSEAFLEGMKRSMDGALAFKQQLNEFLTRALHENQAPARSDTDSILIVLRSLEERVLDRIDQLEERVLAVEAHLGREATREESPVPRSKSTGAKRAKGAAK